MNLGDFLVDDPFDALEIEKVSRRRSKAERLLDALDEVLGEIRHQKQRSEALLTAAQLMTHQQAHPLAIDHLLFILYGESWYLWEPETVWDELERTFGTPPGELTKAKIEALRTLGLNKSFWAYWEVFAPTALCLNNRIVSPHILVKPTIPQIYVAVDIASAFDTFPYSDEVSRFIASVFLDDGVVWAVPPLDFVNPDLVGRRYRCLDCGNDEVDEYNQVCDECFSTNIERYEANHLTEQQKQFIQRVVSGDDVTIPETREGVIAAKLKVAVDYMNYRRQQLRHQLKLIEDRFGR